jgi:hypothetical protein
MNAVELARRLQPYQMFFVEDILPPEQIAYYRNIREICTTPQAVGEVFSHPFEVVPLVKDRLIDFIRCRVAATGGITPIKKLTTLCEIFGVRTAFQEGGENDPINQIASYHVDISSSAFGIQEENHFPPIVHEMFPGMGEIRKGYLYGSGKPGLGVDINEELAAKNPLGPIQRGVQVAVVEGGPPVNTRTDFNTHALPFNFANRHIPTMKRASTAWPRSALEASAARRCYGTPWPCVSAIAISKATPSTEREQIGRSTTRHGSLL